MRRRRRAGSGARVTCRGEAWRAVEPDRTGEPLHRLARVKTRASPVHRGERRAAGEYAVAKRGAEDPRGVYSTRLRARPVTSPHASGAGSCRLARVPKSQWLAIVEIKL
jgi:hypothetical protein